MNAPNNSDSTISTSTPQKAISLQAAFHSKPPSAGANKPSDGVLTKPYPGTPKPNAFQRSMGKGSSSPESDAGRMPNVSKTGLNR